MTDTLTQSGADVGQKQRRRRIALVASKGTLDQAYPPLILATTASASVQQVPQPIIQRPVFQQAPSIDVGYALNDWRRLRQSEGYAFADYARFVTAYPGWPGDGCAGT